MTESILQERGRVSPPRRRWLRWLLAGWVLVMAGLVLSVVLLMSAWNKDLAEALAETDRSDPEWRLTEIEAKRPAIPDEENSSVQMARSRQARPAKWLIWYFPPNTPGADLVLADPEGFSQRLEDVPPQVRLDAEQERVLGSEMKRGAAAVADARRLIDLPRGRHPIVWKKDYVSSLIPNTQQSRDVVAILRYDVLLRCQDGDLDGAMQSVRASFNSSLALRDEPFAVSQLVRIACRKITLNALERVLAQGEPSAKELEEFQRVLEEDEKENPFLLAMRAERGMIDGFLEVVQRGDMTHAELRDALGGLSNYSAGANWAGTNLETLALRGTARHERAVMLRRLNRMVEIAQLPPREQGREVDAWLAQVQQGSSLEVKVLSPVKKIHGATRRSHADMRCAIVMLAVERFRRANQRWPDHLEELTPHYLNAVPVDPFKGGPIRYVKRDDGVTIYSVGPDEEDNGGNVDGKSLAAGYDWGFRLWNVDRRGQQPPH